MSILDTFLDNLRKNTHGKRRKIKEIEGQNNASFGG